MNILNEDINISLNRTHSILQNTKLIEAESQQKLRQATQEIKHAMNSRQQEMASKSRTSLNKLRNSESGGHYNNLLQSTSQQKQRPQSSNVNAKGSKKTWTSMQKHEKPIIRPGSSVTYLGRELGLGVTEANTNQRSEQLLQGKSLASHSNVSITRITNGMVECVDSKVLQPQMSKHTCALTNKDIYFQPLNKTVTNYNLKEQLDLNKNLEYKRDKATNENWDIIEKHLSKRPQTSVQRAKPVKKFVHQKQNKKMSQQFSKSTKLFSNYQLSSNKRIDQLTNYGGEFITNFLSDGENKANQSHIVSPSVRSRNIPQKSEGTDIYLHKNRRLLRNASHASKPVRPSTADHHLIKPHKEVITYQKSDVFNLIEQEKKIASRYTQQNAFYDKAYKKQGIDQSRKSVFDFGRVYSGKYIQRSFFDVKMNKMNNWFPSDTSKTTQQNHSTDAVDTNGMICQSADQNQSTSFAQFDNYQAIYRDNDPYADNYNQSVKKQSRSHSRYTSKAGMSRSRITSKAGGTSKTDKVLDRSHIASKIEDSREIDPVDVYRHSQEFSLDQLLGIKILQKERSLEGMSSRRKKNESTLLLKASMKEKSRSNSRQSKKKQNKRNVKTVFKSLDISNTKKAVVPSNQANRTSSNEQNNQVPPSKSSDKILAGGAKIINQSDDFVSLDVKAKPIPRTLSPRRPAVIQAQTAGSQQQQGTTIKSIKQNKDIHQELANGKPQIEIKDQQQEHFRFKIMEQKNQQIDKLVQEQQFIDEVICNYAQNEPKIGQGFQSDIDILNNKFQQKRALLNEQRHEHLKLYSIFPKSVRHQLNQEALINELIRQQQEQLQEEEEEGEAEQSITVIHSPPNQNMYVTPNFQEMISQDKANNQQQPLDNLKIVDPKVQQQITSDRTMSSQQQKKLSTFMNKTYQSGANFQFHQSFNKKIQKKNKGIQQQRYRDPKKVIKKLQIEGQKLLQLEDYLGIEHPVVPAEPSIAEIESVANEEDKIETIESPKYDPQQELTELEKPPPFLQHYAQIYQIFKPPNDHAFQVAPFFQMCYPNQENYYENSHTVFRSFFKFQIDKYERDAKGEYQCLQNISSLQQLKRQLMSRSDKIRMVQSGKEAFCQYCLVMQKQKEDSGQEVVLEESQSVFKRIESLFNEDQNNIDSEYQLQGIVPVHNVTDDSQEVQIHKVKFLNVQPQSQKTLSDLPNQSNNQVKLITSKQSKETSQAQVPNERSRVVSLDKSIREAAPTPTKKTIFLRGASKDGQRQRLVSSNRTSESSSQFTGMITDQIIQSQQTINEYANLHKIDQNAMPTAGSLPVYDLSRRYNHNSRSNSKQRACEYSDRMIAVENGGSPEVLMSENVQVGLNQKLIPKESQRQQTESTKKIDKSTIQQIQQANEEKETVDQITKEEPIIRKPNDTNFEMISYNGLQDFINNQIDFSYDERHQEIYNQLKDICLKQIMTKIITQFNQSNDQKQQLYSGEAYFIEFPNTDDDMNIQDSKNETIVKLLLITNLKNQVQIEYEAKVQRFLLDIQLLRDQKSLDNRLAENDAEGLSYTRGFGQTKSKEELVSKDDGGPSFMGDTQIMDCEETKTNHQISNFQLKSPTNTPPPDDGNAQDDKATLTVVQRHESIIKGRKFSPSPSAEEESITQ